MSTIGTPLLSKHRKVLPKSVDYQTIYSDLLIEYLSKDKAQLTVIVSSGGGILAE